MRKKLMILLIVFQFVFGIGMICGDMVFKSAALKNGSEYTFEVKSFYISGRKIYFSFSESDYAAYQSCWDNKDIYIAVNDDGLAFFSGYSRDGERDAVNCKYLFNSAYDLLDNYNYEKYGFSENLEYSDYWYDDDPNYQPDWYPSFLKSNSTVTVKAVCYKKNLFFTEFQIDGTEIEKYFK